MAEAFELLYQQTFIAVLLGLFGLERLRLLRRRPSPSPARWVPNVSLFLLGGLLGRVLFPASVVALAASIAEPGLMARAGLPFAAEWVVGLLLLDLLNYGLHRLSHRNALLWRVHLVHHSDIQVDVTTAERHHPIESLISAAVSAAVVVALGLPWQAVAAYALAAAIASAWSHANLRLPERLESMLGRVIVTPGVHVLHHSAARVQTNSNYGTILTLWDRLFSTFIDPAHQRPVALGLEYFRQPRDNTLTSVLLRQPFGRAQPMLAAVDTTAAARDATEVRALPPTIGSDWRRAWLELAIGGGLLALAMAPTMLAMVAQWSQGDAYRSAWLVVPMLVYAFGWHWREEILAWRPRPSLAGIVAVALAAVVWAVAHLMNIEIGRQLALVFMMLGLALAALGGPIFRRWLPALGLLFFMVPSGDLLQPILRSITVEGLKYTLGAVGLAIQTDGFWLSNGANRYFVADACSGLSHVTLLAFLGYAFGLLIFRSFIRVAALALLGGLFGVLSNLVRVNSIVLLDHLHGTQMDLAAHGHVQWVSLGIALVFMLLVVARSRIDTAPDAAGPADMACDEGAATPGQWRYRAGLWAGLVGVAVAGPVTIAAPDGAPSTKPLLAAALPHELAGWAWVDMPKPLIADAGRLAASQAWRYERGARQLRVDVIQARSRAYKLSERAVAPFGAEEWRDIQRSTEAVCSPGGCQDVIHTVWRRSMKTPFRQTYVAFVVGDIATASQLRLRAASAWFGLSRHPVSPHMIALTVDGNELPAADVETLLRSIAQRL